ncbi:MAG: prepilin-type N-terminal cleavage/methylation domain-containing protein [Synergistaceae bacterium]|nr:prepilin-type N-terminal cleavage/methylation domain-containing protein [Synergistaceae bacterium]
MRKGFTLLEILIAVMLTGMLATLALAPVVFTVRRVVETQERYSDVSALQRTMNFITRDLNSAMRLAANVITIIDHESMGNRDDDILMIMSSAPSVQGLPAGTLVYKLNEGGINNNNIIPGLYRWIIPGKAPNSINHEKLRGEDGQLVLPYVSAFKVEVPTNSRADDNKKDFAGPLPHGIYIKISRKNLDNTQIINNGVNNNESENLDELESVIVFP